MQFSNNEVATYLYCAQLPQTRTTPLTILEWNAVVKSLSELKKQPEILLNITSENLEKVITKATTESQKNRIIKKIEARQKLGISMLELKEITHQGYGIMFRSQMPRRLKKLTHKFLPPFFYYAGDTSILSHRTVGVVGARDANTEELSQTAKIGKEASQHGVVIISGGARGVDTTAVESTLNNGGKAIVFPSEGLKKWINKSSIRNYILNGQLLLMSTQKLNAPFTGPYAMLRNKFIHAPSDAVIVTSSKISGKKASGTWEGVLENLKFKWSPIYVIGNSEGVERLKTEGNASPFSSLEEIFKENTYNTKFPDSKMDDKIVSIIQLAIAKGLDKETIDKKFLELSTRCYNNIGNKHNMQNKRELLIQEQLSLEDYMNQ